MPRERRKINAQGKELESAKTKALAQRHQQRLNAAAQGSERSTKRAQSAGGFEAAMQKLSGKVRRALAKRHQFAEAERKVVAAAVQARRRRVSSKSQEKARELVQSQEAKQQLKFELGQ